MALTGHERSPGSYTSMPDTGHSQNKNCSVPKGDYSSSFRLLSARASRASRYLESFRTNQTKFPLVYVSVDGSVRELSEGQKGYVSQKFMFGDGARPWIKPTYRSVDGWGNLSGYVQRR
jgi:hypothetical protein